MVKTNITEKRYRLKIIKHRVRDNMDIVTPGAFTYKDLLLQLKSLPEPILKQSVQVINPGPDGSKPMNLCPVLCLDTCDMLEIDNTRNADDHKHHGAQLVLLSDYHKFGDDGRIATELVPGKSILEYGIAVFPKEPPKWSGKI